MNYPWEVFFKEKALHIFTTVNEVWDIGGGLRIDRKRNNRLDPKRLWLKEYAEKIDYKIIDPVPDYNPDVVGDIHELPFDDNSVEAICCMAVLEHVENPILAASEMHRVLKPGGKLLVYVPFLYYYHAHEGYYKDFWRFTPDSLNYIFRNFSHIELESVRYPIETLVRLSPLGRFSVFTRLAHMIDKACKKHTSKQVSGYYVYLEK